MRWLVLYYGLIQLIHLVGTLGTVMGDSVGVMRQVSPLLTDEQVKVLLFSTYLDLFFSAPSGILFAWGYFKKNKLKALGPISLTFASASALFYGYVLWIWGAWRWTPLNTFVLLAFLPIALLIGVYLKNYLDQKRS